MAVLSGIARTADSKVGKARMCDCMSGLEEGIRKCQERSRDFEENAERVEIVVDNLRPLEYNISRWVRRWAFSSVG